MIIKSFGITKEFNKGTKLIDILKSYTGLKYIKYICAKIQNTIIELHDEINEDCEIEFLDITSREAMTIYQSTLRYIMSLAVHNLFPGTRIIYNYSISRSIFCQPVGLKRITSDTVNQITREMEKIISSNLAIKKVKVSIDEAIEIYKKQGYKSKVEALKLVKDKREILIYKTNDYYNYMETMLAPSTGFTPLFKVILYLPGFILQYPRSEDGGLIPKFQDELVLSHYLKDQNLWGQIIGASNIAEYNQIVETGNAGELINLCETRHNNMLAELGENISRNIENIKLIAVAGPSSSGKTTFTNRLRIELISRGIKPLMISLDNYYKTNGYPLNEDGSPDFEHIEALDLALFSQQMLELIDGEEVRIPIFNFVTRERSFGEPIKLSKNRPILIEGIHALNERLTEVIPSGNKYQIYIAPVPQLHIDSQNPISLPDIRLLRRLVRDYRDRGASPQKTINMWDSVRRGEFKWIYPYQENADYVFNSELTYELGVMRNPALEILSQVTVYDSEYPTAQRLKRILRYVTPLDSKFIPSNSILREFIGGSIFYEK